MDRIIYVVWQITIDYSKSKNIVKLNLIKLYTMNVKKNHKVHHYSKQFVHEKSCFVLHSHETLTVKQLCYLLENQVLPNTN